MTSVAVSRAAPATGLVAVAAVGVYALHWPDPFQPGLLSAVLYVAPLVIAGLAIRRMAKSHTARGVRRVLVEALVILAGLLVLAVPLGFLQRTLASAIWFSGSGVPSHAWTQVITVPGIDQNPYLWDARQHRLIAYFYAPADPENPTGSKAAIETVRSGASTPCISSAEYPDGDGGFANGVTCTRAAHGLWMLRTRDGTGTGFVRRTDGVTVTLTGSSTDRGQLQRAILAAHPASDTELWSRINSIPARATLIVL